MFVNEDPDEDEYVEEELSSLCEAAGVEPAGFVRQRVSHPNTATYIGKGKVEELMFAIKEEGADIALFDCELNGIQQRNLEEALRARVVDRTQLILDIFAQRAHTREGILQVELAQYSYLLPKVTSVYTEFERQKGGIGLRGPGETKLEADKRRIKDRIAALKRELDEVRQQRGRQREGRRKVPFPFACIVGYTSAGKSTLMNTLSGSHAFVDPMLFATLDPTTRRVELPEGYSVYLTDTVGFIRNLPTQLVAAFRATLEEVTESDILIHVVDAGHPNWRIQSEAVLETLDSIGAGDKPILTVFNKVDKLKDKSVIRELVATQENSVGMSALMGYGIEAFMDVLVRMIRSLLRPVQFVIPYAKSGLLQDCYTFGRVLEVEHKEDGIHVKAELVIDAAERIIALASSAA